MEVRFITLWFAS